MIEIISITQTPADVFRLPYARRCLLVSSCEIKATVHAPSGTIEGTFYPTTRVTNMDEAREAVRQIMAGVVE